MKKILIILLAVLLLFIVFTRFSGSKKTSPEIKRMVAEDIVQTVEDIQENTKTYNWIGNYYFEHNKDWEVTQKERWTSVKSPDYDMSGSTPLLSKGAELSVSVTKDLGYEDLASYFEDDALLSGYATDIEETTFMEYPAYKYTLTYEGYSENTAFILWGDLYTLSMRYADNAGKTAFWSNYELMLDTFSFIE